MKIDRGDVVVVDLEPVRGSEQGGVRPCVVIQNNIGNKYSPLTIVAPVTAKLFTKEYATNVKLSRESSGLKRDSTVLLNQIKTIDKSRVVRKVRKLKDDVMRKIDMAINVSLGLD